MKKFVKRAISQVIALALAFQIVGQCGYSFAVQADYSSKSEIVTESNADNVSENDVVAQNDENTEEIDEPSEDEIVYEDMTINSDTTLTAQTEVKDLYINYGTLNLNENTLIVHGNVVIQNRGCLNFNKGELICNDFTMTGTYYSRYMYMRNANDHLVVEGNFNFNGGSFSGDDATAGIIELRGNVNITTGFNPSREQKVVLNGLDSQEVYINEKNCSFNILEVSNTSEGGILSDYPISANSMIGDLSQIHYSFGGAVGTVLSGDMELDNYCLSVGELDLNGHTLTINGDFIQAGGEVKINNGKLVVNGDYRIQTRKNSEDGTESYDYSTGILNMTNESNVVEVSGDFVMGSTKSHNGKLSAGILTVGGNFTQLNYKDSDNFSASGSHKVIFTSEKDHAISFDSSRSGESHFANLTFEDDSKITLKNDSYKRVTVTGSLTGTGCEISGYIDLAGAAKVVNKYKGNIRISEGYTLNSDISISGNFSAESYLYLNGKQLSTDGNVTISSYIGIQSGTLNCKGNLVVNYYSGRINMDNSSGVIDVEGNFVFNGGDYTSYLTKGKLYIAGDCTINYSTFNSNTDNEIIFDGTEKQVINVTNSYVSLNKIIFNNTSEDGIEIKNSFNYAELVNESGCKVIFANGGTVGETLSADKVVDGDYILAMGELDLNGHTLTINGDFIQAGGEVKINSGKLVVNGNYRIQTKKATEDGKESYDYSTGILNMTNESDVVEVSGDFVMGSTKSHDGKLSAGTLTVGGNFTQLSYNARNNFVASGSHKVIFTSEKNHAISFDSSRSGESHFANLTFEDGSEITLKNATAAVTGELNGTNCAVTGYVGLTGSAKVIDTYAGSIRIIEGYTLNSDIDISGELLIDATLNLNGKTFNVGKNVNVNSYLHVRNGRLNCKGDFYANYYSEIYMQNEKDILNVEGTFTFSNLRYSCDFSNGTLIIGGNCNVNGGDFRATAAHKTIFNGEQKQIINVTNTYASFGKIIFNNTSEDGIEVKNSFNYAELVNESGCKVIFANGGTVGETLSADKVVDGDYILAMGELDLNGHTLTINGDFIQAGGEVKINSGKLVVNGNYRIQTKKATEDGKESYDYSTGILNMTNESDVVEVSGDFVMGSTKSHDGKLSAGTLTVGGNFTQLSYNARNNFVASGSHKVIFTSEKNHAISFDSSRSGESHFANLTFEDGSEITLKNATAAVTGELNGTNCAVTGYVGLTGSAKVIDTYAGSIRIIEGYTLNSDIDISGELLIDATLNLNGKTFNVGKNVNVNSYLHVRNGRLNCKGDFYANYYSEIYMQNEKDILNVEGTFTFSNLRYSCDFSNGTLIIGGNCNVNGGDFRATAAHKTIFNGEQKQIINVTNTYASFGKIIFNNTSEDGIEVKNSFNYAELVNESGCKVIFANGGTVGETLSADKVVDGDYILAMGELDLNGHTLTINGDFIQAGGEVKINSGKLVVNGNYRIQTKKATEDGKESYDYSTGILNMTNESDVVEVSGDFVMGSTKSHDGKLSAGTLTIGGDFTQQRYKDYDNFSASGSHTVEFNGKIKQNILFVSPSDSRFFNLKVNNTNGVSLNSSVFAYGNVNDVNNSVCESGYLYITKLSQLENGSFGGNICINNGNNNSDIYLTQDLTIGNLTCSNLHLKGYKLNVKSLSINSKLFVEGGAIECKNNLTLGDYGCLIMTNAKDYVLVGKNFIFNTYYSTSGDLTAGTLEIKGDFIQNKNTVFVCSETHTTILSGKIASNGRIYVQTVTMYSNGSKFNKLIITKPGSFYVAKNQNNTTVSLKDLCNELIEDYDDIEPPTKVTGLTVSEISATSIHIVWEQSSDNVRVTGYEVYRNGEKIVTTGRTEFIDGLLEPNTAYTYQVYAFDESRNYSVASDKINPKTLADTDSPETPHNVKIKSVTGSSLTLSWSASKDNVGTEGYIIYCNNEEIARTEECEFKHSSLNENEEYSYMIKAYDKAGNLSDFSENITGYVVMPKITSITPGDLSSLGGKSQTIVAFFDKISSDGGNKVRFEFSKSGKDEYMPISKELIGAQNYSANKLCAKCSWNTEGLDGNYDIRVTLFDDDDNSDCVEVMYTVTSSGPKPPQNLKAETDNGVIMLTWKKSVSADCQKYIIYRQDSEDEEFEPIVEIGNSATVRYTDKNVVAGNSYSYKISGVNSFDIEGNTSNVASVTATEDKVLPEVKSIIAEKNRLNKTAKITVAADDNLSVDTVSLEYMTLLDEEWSLIGKSSCKDGSAVFEWNTIDLIDGSYKLRAIAVDSNGNESKSFEKIFTIDNTGISKIILDKDNCTTASTHITLRWNDITDTDFGYFAVEQKNEDGTFTEVGTTKDATGLHVQKLMPDKEYTFRVVGYDDIGNRGEESDEITLSTKSDTISPAITAFYPESKAFNSKIDISIFAADNAAVSSVKLRYSYDSGDDKVWYDIAEITADSEKAENTFKHSFDVSSMNEGKIYIQAIAVDSSGNESNAVVNEYIVDRTAPVTVSDLTAQTGEGNIHLIWTVTSEDTEKFVIYRSEENLGSYSKIAECSTKDYYDTSAKLGIVYSYKIVAVDIAGNKSEYSNETIAQITDDNIKPKFLGFSIKSGSSVSANPKLKAVTWDNYALASVTIEYKAKDSSDSVWYEIGTYALSSNYEMTEFNWDTDGLADGKYEFRAYCADLMGNISETYTSEFLLDATAPDAPVLELLQDNFRIRLEWSASKADDLDHYRLYRKSSKNEEYKLITETTDLSYIDENVEPYKNHTYKVEAYDKTGNVSASNEISGYAYDVDTITPQIDMPKEIYGIAGEEIAFDGSACTDNVRIKRFVWDMGDGNTIFGVRNSYIYDEAGEYTVTLTVEDATKNSSTSQIKVIVYEPSEYGFVNVEVTDSGNNPLSYSYIYVYSGDSEGIHTMRTGYDGTLKLCAKIGDNKIAAYKDGYLPEEKEIAINNEGDNGTVRLALQSGELVTGDLEVHRMSLEEMAEAGIDFYDPSNYHTVKFTVKLTFAQEPIPTIIEYIYTGNGGHISGNGTGENGGTWCGGGTYGTGSGGNISFSPVVSEDIPEEERPILAYVYVRQSISFMKDMYAVNLGVLNNADKQFVIEDSSATLNLPYGLSLATNKQSLTQSMDSIAGQQQKTVGWSVRGDRKGEYDLSADFKGTLMPFGAPVSASFKTSTPFTVGAGDGIVIHVMPESCAYIGEKYYVQLAVANEGSDTFYNLTTDFGPYINPGYKQYITITHPDGSVEVQEDESASYEIQSADECEYIPVISGGQHVRVKVFKPGDVIYGTYCQTFSATGDPDQVYYKLINSVVEQLTGDTNVKVVVEPIASHITKFNVKQKIVDNSWADPVDMTTGAYTDQVPAMSVTGESPLTLNLNYNSLNACEKGQLGYGWSHDFEAYLDVKSTVINVHWNPTAYSSFVDERSATRNVNGEIIDGRLVLHKPNDTGVKNYVCISSGMSEYFMSRDENNIYTLEIPDGQKYVFDSDGKLIQIIQPNEKTVTLEHIGNTTVITEDVSGAKLVLNYNDSGLLTSVGDGNGRITSITYENDLIKSVTNPLGETVVYTYDANNRLVTSALDGNSPYVTNTYDEEGRVLTQDDADPDTPLSYFSYSESENNEFIVDGIDRNGNTVKYVSDGMGHLLSVTDQNNNTVKYSYDLKGNLLDETTADGKTTVYTYDDDNNLIKVKDPSGYVTVMTYDGNGNILTVTGPNGETNSYTYNVKNLLETQTEYTSARKSYTYNKNGQILTEAIEGLGVRTYSYTNGKITSVSDYENNLSENTYDEYGNLRSQTDREGHQTVYNYDLLNRVISITNEDGTESYTYDSMGNKTSVTDSRGNTTYYTYNSNNWLISTTNAKGTVTFEYDNEGRLIRQTNTDGTAVVNTCDAVGNIISTTNENGEVTKFAYDAANRMISKTVVDCENEYTESYEYYPNGKIKKTTFADGTSESYTYDKQWRLVKTTDEQGNYSTSEYDAANNLLSTTDAEGNTASYTYDKYGRMLNSTDANGNVTTYDEYDFNGLCTQKTFPNGQVVKIGYNKEGMVTKTTFVAEDENGEDISVFYEYDAMGRVTKYTNQEGYSTFTEYDENGNIVKLTDAEGNVVTNQYDEINSLILSTDAMDVDTQYTYDSVGNLVKTIENLNTTREEKTENVYDNLGRIINSTDAESGTAKYEYDRLGNVSSQIDPNGGRTEYTYDNMGRLTETINPIGGTKTYTYDDVGQLASQKNARGQETTYEYYKNGWIKSFTDELGTVSYTYDGNGNVLTVTDENGTITREYDNMNRVTKYTDFRGNTIEYSYDQLGNLVALTYPGGRVVRYTYYKTGNVKTVTDWDGKVTSFEYDGNGRLTKTSRADGSVEERTYDANGRLVTIVDKNGENVINQKVYSYDESGNVTEISSSDGTTMDGLTSSEMKYNENNQLIEYNGEEVKYDADGNMIYGPLNGKMAEFEYDCRNRLVSAGGISYEYDAENNRISQTENGAKTEYVVDSNSSSLTRILTAEKEGDTTYYIYGIGLIAQENGNEYLIYHFNNIGSTEAVTNIDGEIVETFDYGPYGELLSENKCGIMFLYNGELGVATDSNGLYYMRARYYNPEIKRFINQDVMTGSIVNTPTLNRYAYVNGNPISLNDPFGLSPFLNWLDGITGHDILDLLGMLPGIGFVFDGINAAWYAQEGDYYNAACSLVSALPGAGDALGVFAKTGKSCKLVTAFHKTGSAGNLMIGSYELGKTADKYISGDASFTWEEIKGDLFKVAMTGTSMWGSAKDFGTSYCFVAGTLVTTEDGFKTIEEIEVGDKVLSEDETTGEVAVKTVTETYVNETDELIHIGVNGETISATPTHPFYVDKLGWTLARSLRAGDVLVLSNGELVTVEWVQHEILESPIKVYNFEVQDFHTYFVGQSSVLVHNDCEKSRLPRSNGDWDGIPGESNWKSSNNAVNKITNGESLPFKNGRPDFSKWSKGSLNFKSGVLTGTDKDFRLVYKEIKKNMEFRSQKEAKKWLKNKGLTPHHSSLTEIQLIPTDLHANIPHIGSASDLRILNN